MMVGGTLVSKVDGEVQTDLPRGVHDLIRALKMEPGAGCTRSRCIEGVTSTSCLYSDFMGWVCGSIVVPGFFFFLPFPRREP